MQENVKVRVEVHCTLSFDLTSFPKSSVPAVALREARNVDEWFETESERMKTVLGDGNMRLEFAGGLVRITNEAGITTHIF